MNDDKVPLREVVLGVAIFLAIAWTAIIYGVSSTYEKITNSQETAVFTTRH